MTSCSRFLSSEPARGSSWLTTLSPSSQISPTPQLSTSYLTTCTGIQCPSMSAPGIFRPPPPRNEPVRDYAPGSPERASLQIRLEQMKHERPEIPMVIGGEDVKTGNLREAVM